MSADDADKKQREKERQNELRKQIDVEEVWNQVEINEDRMLDETLSDNRPGWKTVRIFVSSTFKDFHQEREVLIKQVFADLRLWCEERQLHLIDCDLRWGVPKETTSEVTLKTCLEEIDRCYEDNKVPYFLNMTCKRVGWIPLQEELPPNLWTQYQLVFGLSVTEMEIVHAAYRIENPNALFLIRDPSFLDEIEDVNVKNEFVDELQPKADEKLNILKDKINTRFSDRVFTYKCKYLPGERLYSDYTPKGGRPKLQLDENFSKKILDFFKERISAQYPLVKASIDQYLEAKFHHEAFLRSRVEVIVGRKQRCDLIIGREDVLKQIEDYIKSDAPGYPKIIVGEAGAGKSSIVAKATSEVMKKVEEKLLPCKGCSNSNWTVFFHFVGAVPNSTSLLEILRRLLKEIEPDIDFPETLDETMQLVKSELSNDRRCKPIIIFIDALNQIDRDMNMESTFWLPDKLSRNVRIILSLISDSEPHSALKKRNLQDDSFVSVPDLKVDKRHEIVKNYLGLFNKKLEPDQTLVLFDKAHAKNPLWLRIACEELRIYGDFGSITEFIKSLKDSLPDLLKQVLERFEKESDRVLLISTLCLLEVSRFGLLETELLEILADKDNLEYRDIAYSREDNLDRANVVEKGHRLPAMEWASVYRNLRFFLRPYGNPSEGRLDFYHRSLSKVVQDKYLDKGSSTENKKRFWWHKKLADFYRNSGTYDRRVEEYPYHLIQLKKYASKSEAQKYCKWLEEFLLDMEAFKRLYDDEFSGTLLLYWRECGDDQYERMSCGYRKFVEDMRNDINYTPMDRILKVEQISRLLVQAGRYKEGLGLAEECLEMLKFRDQFKEEDYNEKMMYLLGHKAHIKSLLLPPTQSAKEIPELEEIIQLHSNAIDIIKASGKLDDKKYKKYLALQLIKTAYARGGIASRSEMFSLSFKFFSGKKTKKDMLTQGMKEVDEAIKLYRELSDFGHELEAQLTLATLHRGDKDKQLEIYEETIQRCSQIFGENHHLMCRLCFNTAIVYEDAKDSENAYKYFRKAYEIALNVFGTQHSMTEKYREALKEKKYATIGRRLGHSIN